MKRDSPTLLQLARQIALDLLFALLILVHAAGRWFARQVLARIAYVLLLALAAVLLTDAEKGEPQPQAAPDHA